MPRAIAFTAALYSIGLPPEILGLNALDDNDFQFIKEVYVNFENDLRDAIGYFNPDIAFLPQNLKARVVDFLGDFQPDEEYREVTNYIATSLKEDKAKELEEHILRAASLRKFLG